jgi:hypothetical protein
VDTELAARDLLSSRMAYVSVSRGAHDAQLFTNDREKLPAALGHEVFRGRARVPAHKPEQSIAPSRRTGHATIRGHALELVSKTTCPGYLQNSPAGGVFQGC